MYNSSFNPLLLSNIVHKAETKTATNRNSLVSSTQSTASSSKIQRSDYNSMSSVPQFTLNHIVEEGREFDLHYPSTKKESRSSSMSSTVSSVNTNFNTFLMDEQMNNSVQVTEEDGIKSPNLAEQGTMLVPSLSTISLLSLNSCTDQLAQFASFDINSPAGQSQLSLNGGGQELTPNRISHSRKSSFSNCAASAFVNSPVVLKTSQQTQKHFKKQRHPSFTNYYTSHRTIRPHQGILNSLSNNQASNNSQPIPINPQTPQISPSSLNNSPSGFLLNQTTLPASLQHTPTLSRVNNSNNNIFAQYKEMTIRSPEFGPVCYDQPMTPLNLNTSLQKNQ